MVVNCSPPKPTSQLQKIKCMHKGNKPPSVHVLGDFSFGDIVWPDRLNKSGSPLSPSVGEILIEIMNDYGLEQLVHFPTRENQRTNGPVNAHLISGPSKSTKLTKPGHNYENDLINNS